MTHATRPLTPATAPPPPSLPADDAARFALQPTPRTIARRTFLPLQLWRFVVINLRMLRMIAKSHH